MILDSFILVTREPFFAKIYELSSKAIDVHPSIKRTPYPYTSEWKKRSGEVVGVTEIFFPEGSALEATRYFLKTT
jgi:hypothetical protein